MTDSWLSLDRSEKLHQVYRGNWHDSIVPKAEKIASSPVPFLSEGQDHGIQFSIPDGTEQNSIGEFIVPNISDLPPEIADILFGSSSIR
jgi:hypothetical protein